MTLRRRFAPRNVIRLQQATSRLSSPAACAGAAEAAAIEEMNLIDVRDADHRGRRQQRSVRQLPHTFHGKPSGSGFAVFHEMPAGTVQSRVAVRWPGGKAGCDPSQVTTQPTTRRRFS